MTRGSFGASDSVNIIYATISFHRNNFKIKIFPNKKVTIPNVRFPLFFTFSTDILEILADMADYSELLLNLTL